MLFSYFVKRLLLRRNRQRNVHPCHRRRCLAGLGCCSGCRRRTRPPSCLLWMWWRMKGKKEGWGNEVIGNLRGNWLGSLLEITSWKSFLSLWSREGERGVRIILFHYMGIAILQSPFRAGSSGESPRMIDYPETELWLNLILLSVIQTVDWNHDRQDILCPGRIQVHLIRRSFCPSFFFLHRLPTGESASLSKYPLR